MWALGIIIVILILRFIFKEDKSYTPKYTPKYKSQAPLNTIPQKITSNKPKKLKSKNKIPDNLVITDEFQSAFDLMESSSKSAYITGKAGTGKSTLLNYFRLKTKKKIIVLAPTGIAAINIEGATIHSFFRFAPQLIEKKNISKDYRRAELFNKLDMIIIDEISMVRADLLDGIDYSLRINRGNDLPFGGVQMIFFGDLYQLPPVVVGRDLINYFEEQFGGFYFFNAKVFESTSFDYIELQRIFRQRDEDFKKILNSIRENKVTFEDLNLLNKRYNPDYSLNMTNVSLTLSTTNKIAEDINIEHINKIQTKEYLYPAIITGKFEQTAYPTESNLILKVGAQIMMLKNDSQKRWVNGTLGIVIDLSDIDITVEIDGFIHTVEKATWEVIEYEYNAEEKKIESIITGSFTQYPVKLAWAITIHKSQGQTFENVIIDLGSGAFAHGQTYVALSRCTSLEGIILKTQIRHKDIILDPKVARFVSEKTS